MRWMVAVVMTVALSGCDELAEREMDKVENKVAKDTEEQYEMVKRGGDPIELCVHAGLVAAAWLQAKDEDRYQRWKAIEKQDCAAASGD